MPADGNAGWIDEAIATWGDSGYLPSEKEPKNGVNMGARSPYARTTSRAECRSQPKAGACPGRPRPPRLTPASAADPAYQCSDVDTQTPWSTAASPAGSRRVPSSPKESAGPAAQRTPERRVCSPDSESDRPA